MTPKQLMKWRDDMKTNYLVASIELGIDIKTWYNYINGTGKKGIPRSIDLACAAIAADLKPYSEQ